MCRGKRLLDTSGAGILVLEGLSITEIRVSCQDFKPSRITKHASLRAEKQMQVLRMVLDFCLSIGILIQACPDSQAALHRCVPLPIFPFGIAEAECPRMFNILARPLRGLCGFACKSTLTWCCVVLRAMFCKKVLLTWYILSVRAVLWFLNQSLSFVTECYKSSLSDKHPAAAPSSSSEPLSSSRRLCDRHHRRQGLVKLSAVEFTIICPSVTVCHWDPLVPSLSSSLTADTRKTLFFSVE
jgi:hypothetical protein